MTTQSVIVGVGGASDGGPGAGVSRLSPARLLARVAMPDLPLARAWMCEELRTRCVSEEVLEVMAAVPRHAFAPPTRWRGTYVDQDIWTGITWMTSPGTVARVLDALSPVPDMRILEIGTGTGYQSALLDGLGAQVLSVDVSAACTAFAGETLRSLGATGVRLLTTNGLTQGVAAEGFDAVLVNAALTSPPGPLLESLLPDGGVLIMPTIVSDGSQRLLEYELSRSEATFVDLGSCRFQLADRSTHNGPPLADVPRPA